SFFTAPAPPEIHTLSLHDALPISSEDVPRHIRDVIGEALAGRSLELANLESCAAFAAREPLIKAQLGGDLHEALLALRAMQGDGDRKSTRLNSSHLGISYAVFCLK